VISLQYETVNRIKCFDSVKEWVLKTTDACKIGYRSERPEALTSSPRELIHFYKPLAEIYYSSINRSYYCYLLVNITFCCYNLQVFPYLSLLDTDGAGEFAFAGEKWKS